jgi:hypothetical protein
MESHHHIERCLEKFSDFSKGLIEDLLAIMARTKYIPRGLENDDFCYTPLTGVFKACSDFFLSIMAQCVSFFGAIQGKGANAVLLIIKNILVRHVFSPSLEVIDK